MDYETLAAELLRALRGRRSQAAFARRLGVRSHAIYIAYENGPPRNVCRTLPRRTGHRSGARDTCPISRDAAR
jgi:hypothetical protein